MHGMIICTREKKFTLLPCLLSWDLENSVIKCRIWLYALSLSFALSQFFISKTGITAFPHATGEMKE